MNKVILMGRLVKNPDVRQDASGSISMARYTLAVGRMRAKKDEDPGADFINCVALGKSAEFVNNYLRKGTKLVIEGRVQTVLSQTLQEVVKKELRGAPDRVALNRRYSVMDANLRLMFSDGMLSGPTYSRLKIILRGEYEDRLEAFTEKDYEEGSKA